MGRKKIKPPAKATDKITRLAERGVKETDIAKAFGISYPVWKRWKTEHDHIKDALQEARSVEEEQLFGMLFEKAMEGDTSAAMFLLKTRHGYNEHAVMNANAVNVQITLPGAKDTDQYENEIQEATNG